MQQGGTGLTNELLSRAESFGFTREEANGFTPQALTLALDRMGRMALQAIPVAAQQTAPKTFGEWAQLQQAAAARTPPQPPPPQWTGPFAPTAPPQRTDSRRAPPVQPPAPPVAPQIPDDLATDPAVQALLPQLQAVQQEVRALRQEREQRQQQEAMREFEQRMQWFDQRCQADQAMTQVLGAGSLLNMNPQSAEAANRARLLDTVNGLEQGLARVPGIKLTRDQLFQEALRLTFPQQHQVAAALQREAQTTQALRDQRGKFVSPTNSRATNSPEGESPELLAAMTRISEKTGIPVK